MPGSDFRMSAVDKARNRRRRVFAAVVSLALGLMVSTAQAQTNDSAIAEALFHDGRALIKAGNAAAACPKFDESYRIEPKVGTLLNLASCHQDIGRTASAWAEFTAAAGEARRQGQMARATYATERADALKKILTRVTVRLDGATPGLVVHVGDRAIAEATLGTALPVDPGNVVVRATAEGKKPWTLELRAPTGPAELEVVIPALEDAEETTTKVPPPKPEPVPAPHEDDAVAPHVLVWVGVALTGAAAIAGGVTGGLALARGGALDCPNNACAPEDEAELDEVRALATVSNVSFGVAGLGVAAVVTGLFLTFPLSSQGQDEAVAAHLGPTWIGLGGRF